MNKKSIFVAFATLLLVTASCTKEDLQDEMSNDNSINDIELKSSSDCIPAPIKDSGWNLVWYDNFDSNTLDGDKWKIGYPWGLTHNHKGYANAENAVVADGMLTLIGGGGMHGNKYNTGVVTAKQDIDFSDPNVEWQIEARLKLANRNGTWPAFWLNSLGGWPNINELDVMEQKGWGPQNKYETVMHFAVKSGNRPSQHRTVTGNNNLDNNWHTYSIAIKKDEVKIKFDNKTVNRVTGSAKKLLRTKTYKIILNLAIGGDWGGNGYKGWIDDFNNTSKYQIDYVAVYKK